MTPLFPSKSNTLLWERLASAGLFSFAADFSVPPGNRLLSRTQLEGGAAARAHAGAAAPQRSRVRESLDLEEDNRRLFTWRSFWDSDLLAGKQREAQPEQRSELQSNPHP